MRGKLLATYFMRVGESRVLDAKGGSLSSDWLIPKEIRRRPLTCLLRRFLHHHHAGTSGLNFQIFSCLTSEMFDIRQFILFCSITLFPNVTPLATLPSYY